MGGARALIASFGASISLVAGAALSLLLVSFVVALDGFAGGVDAAASHPAVTLHGPAPTRSAAPAAKSRFANAVVVEVPAPKATAVVRRGASSRLRAGGGSLQAPQPVHDAGAVIDLAPPGAPSERGSATPSTGDGVREIGDTVSATVQNTGDAVDTVAARLGPPVTQAVQEVLNLIGSLLEDATSGLAGTLDKTVPR
jgi:hypothetical protein